MKKKKTNNNNNDNRRRKNIRRVNNTKQPKQDAFSNRTLSFFHSDPIRVHHHLRDVISVGASLRASQQHPRDSRGQQQTPLRHAETFRRSRQKYR